MRRDGAPSPRGSLLWGNVGFVDRANRAPRRTIFNRRQGVGDEGEALAVIQPRVPARSEEVRSRFGDEPASVWMLAQIALELISVHRDVAVM